MGCRSYAGSLQINDQPMPIIRGSENIKVPIHFDPTGNCAVIYVPKAQHNLAWGKAPCLPRISPLFALKGQHNNSTCVALSGQKYDGWDTINIGLCPMLKCVALSGQTENKTVL